jgi:cell wall-associated NlpC family hydrolase
VEKREIAMRVAWKYLGKPYIWGGDDPSGFDCSGLVIECLKSCGVLPRSGDWTANTLAKSMGWDKIERRDIEEGDLVFWENSLRSRVIHVEMCINQTYAIGASGGGSRTRTVKDAAEQNAFIKIRPIDSRRGVWGYVNPYN